MEFRVVVAPADRAGEGGLARRPDEIAGSRQCRIHPVGARPHPEPKRPLKQIDWYRAVILTTAPDVLLVIVVCSRPAPRHHIFCFVNRLWRGRSRGSAF